MFRRDEDPERPSRNNSHLQWGPEHSSQTDLTSTGSKMSICRQRAQKQEGETSRFVSLPTGQAQSLFLFQKEEADLGRTLQRTPPKMENNQLRTPQHRQQDERKIKQASFTHTHPCKHRACAEREKSQLGNAFLCNKLWLCEGSWDRPCPFFFLCAFLTLITRTAWPPDLNICPSLSSSPPLSSSPLLGN